MTDWTDGRPIFMDLADRIAADILAGLIPDFRCVKCIYSPGRG